MSVYKQLLQTVKNVVVGGTPEGLKPEEIVILPEGRVPHSFGQRCLTIHLTQLHGLTPKLAIRKKVITFGITLSQRIRDIPNDRFGEIAYMDTISMAAVLEDIIPLVESEDTFWALKTATDTIKLPDDTPRYMWEDTFKFLDMNLDPKHLYPSDFGTRAGNDKEQLYAKLAGYSMTAVFDSPVFQLTNSSIQCR